MLSENNFNLISSISIQDAIFVSTCMVRPKACLGRQVAILSCLVTRVPGGALLFAEAFGIENSESFSLSWFCVEILARMLQWKWAQLSYLTFFECPVLHFGLKFTGRWDRCKFIFCFFYFIPALTEEKLEGAIMPVSIPAEMERSEGSSGIDLLVAFLLQRLIGWMGVLECRKR